MIKYLEESANRYISKVILDIEWLYYSGVHGIEFEDAFYKQSQGFTYRDFRKGGRYYGQKSTVG
jgi:hypothetical protein